MHRFFFLFTCMFFLTGCSDKEGQQKVQYQHNQCHRLTLLDEDKQLEVFGAEDIARLKSGNLLISAYDRRSKIKDGVPPTGGLYIVEQNDLSKTYLKVRSLIKQHEGGLRPHGIDALSNQNTHHIAFINRAYVNNKQTVQLVSLNIDDRGKIDKLKIYPIHCRANDIAIHQTKSHQGYIPFSYYVTRDRNACNGVGSVIENVFGLKKGAILHLQGEKTHLFADHLFFPNGIGFQHPDRPINKDNFLAVAQTRAKTLQYFYNANTFKKIPLTGGADNISIDRPGLVVAAIHKSLLKLALYRYQWLGFSTAPSHIIKITGNQKLNLFHDPTGEKFSAASIGVQTGKYLVIGSVGDKGLLVCSS